MGLGLTSKLGCAWVSAWGVWGWCMGDGDVDDVVGRFNAQMALQSAWRARQTHFQIGLVLSRH